MLAGVTVLDLSSVGPAARGTRLLADYGATVVKIVPVPGSGAQTAPPWFAYGAQRGYKRVALDVRDPDGRAAFLSLAAQADVVVESFRPGVVDRLHIGYDDVRAVNADIVYCSTSGYGQDGPRQGWAGHDLNYLAVGGYLACTQRRPDGGPPIPGATIADAAAGGMQAALAICAALLARHATGEGAYLDVSVADGVLWLMSLAEDEHLATGAQPGPGHDVLTGRYACYDTYAAADGRWLAVAAIEPKFFANLCRLTGLEQWVSSQYDDDVQDELRAALAAAFATRGRDNWVAELAGADTCVSPVQEVDEIPDDPQFAARHALVHAQKPDGQVFRQVAPVMAGMAEAADPIVVRDAAVTDTDELLGAAGMDAPAIASLRQKGVAA